MAREDELLRALLARALEALAAVERRLGEMAQRMGDLSRELDRHGEAERDHAAIIARLEAQLSAQDKEVAKINAEKIAGKSAIFSVLRMPGVLAAIIAILLSILSYLGIGGLNGGDAAQ